MDDPYMAAGFMTLSGVIGAALIAGIFGLIQRRNGRKAQNSGNPGTPPICHEVGAKLDDIANTLGIIVGDLRELIGMMRGRGR